MKRFFTATVMTLLSVVTIAQEGFPFKGKIYNEEYQVWIEMNFYDNDITVPQQEFIGELPGYFGAKRDARRWFITDADISGKTATISIINDYGSEDLTATLTLENNGTYTLKQKEGSTMKIAVNKKWVKLPQKLSFKHTDD